MRSLSKPMKRRFIFLSFVFFFVLGVLKGMAGTALDEYKAGLSYYQKCQYEKALGYFQAAADMDMGFWQSYQMAGYCYFYLRDKDNALSAFTESLRLHPRNASLKKFYEGLKGGTLDILLQPVMVNASPEPVGTPVALGPTK